MYRLNEKEFSSATEALDYYISNFNFGNIVIKSQDRCKEFHPPPDRLETYNFNSNLKKPKFCSLNNISTEESKEKNACHEIEKLLNTLSNRILDYKKDEINLTSKNQSELNLKSENKKIKTDLSQDDPILKSLSRFEDLNKQLSSTNLFERIDSSLLIKKQEAIPFTNSTISNNFKSNSCENFLQECMKIMN
jgi:hypothetical protein